MRLVGFAAFAALAALGWTQGGAPTFLWTQDVLEGGAQALDFDSKGHYVAVGDGVSGVFFPGQGYGAGTVRLLDASTGETLQVRNALGAEVDSVSFSPNGDELAVGGLLRAILQVPTLATARPLPYDQYPYHVVSWSPSGSVIAAASESPFNGAKIIDADSGQLLLVLPYATEVADLAFSPDGQYLAVGRSDIQIYRTSDFSIVRFIAGVNGTTYADLDWAPDSRRLAAMRNPAYLDSGDIRIFDAQTGAHLRTLPNGGTDFLTSIDWSPDGRMVGASAVRGASFSGVLLVYRPDSGAVIARYEQGLDLRSFVMKFSPSSRTIAIGHNGEDRFVVSLVTAPKLLTGISR